MQVPLLLRNRPHIFLLLEDRSEYAVCQLINCDCHVSMRLYYYLCTTLQISVFFCQWFLGTKSLAKVFPISRSLYMCALYHRIPLAGFSSRRTGRFYVMTARAQYTDFSQKDNC